MIHKIGTHQQAFKVIGHIQKTFGNFQENTIQDMQNCFQVYCQGWTGLVVFTDFNVQYPLYCPTCALTFKSRQQSLVENHDHDSVSLYPRPPIMLMMVSRTLSPIRRPESPPNTSWIYPVCHGL